MIKLRKFISAASSLLLVSSALTVISPDTADAYDGHTITVGYYDDCPGFQSGSSDDERKSGYAYEYLQEIAKYTGWDYQYRYGSFDEITELLHRGEVDIVAGISEEWKQKDKSSGYVLSQYPAGTEYSELFSIPGALDDDFYIAVYPNGSELADTLNEAQSKILKNDPEFTGKLTRKYFTGSRESTELSFSEKNWLSAHATIKIGYLDNYMPYSDKNDDRNSADGAMVSIFQELNRIIGRSISAVKYSTYAELYAALESGEIDAMFPAYRDLWRLERENLISTTPLVTDSMVYISKNGTDDFSRIAVMSSSPVQTLVINEHHHETEIVHFKDINSCIKAIRKGSADGFIVEKNVLEYYLSDGKDISDLVTSDSQVSIEYCFAVKKSSSALCSILDTAFSKMDSNTVSRAINSNLYRKNSFTFIDFFTHNILRVVIIFSCIAAIAVLLFIRNRITLRKKQNEIDDARKTISSSRLETSKYREKTERDHLTGVFSRGHFTDEARRIMGSHRPDDILQLVMMDIDNFKSVNDTYGHDNGDVVLRRLGEILREIARVNGFAGRFGGEEFLIFLHGNNTEIQEHIITNVCSKLRETDFDFTERHITMSVGVTRISDGDTLDECIERADKALYYSKNHGKNQVNYFENLSGL
ncbi:MAG: GGDEF domain-containing protein [Oscillospiraceae bacterium]|nr:GGDEF domain-containing protein [Oscillospiraceae bacterium]